jgi:acyl-CoA synthetase (AMP-forming)/AMP-acid ligase II
MHGAMQSYPLTLEKFLEHAATWHPEAQVVTGRAGGRTDRVGYAELYRRSRRVSAVLHGLGIRTGDCVATLAWNTQAHVEVWYAVMGLGAVCHTLNVRLTVEQIAMMVAQSRPRILVASADLEPLAQEVMRGSPWIERLLLLDAPEAHHPSALEPLIARADGDEVSWGEFDETAPSGLCFTSGTTGAPKGVTYTHRSSYLHTLRLLQVDGLALSARDRVLTAVPMFHANAWGLPFAAPAAGARLVLPGRALDGAHLAALIASEGVTVAVGVPTVWLNLVEHVERSGATLPTLERIIVGGAPISASLMQRIEQRLNVIVQTTWGMTELSPVGTVTPRYASRAAHRSGRPDIGVDLRLTDADGQPLAAQRGVEGHLRVRGPAVIARYFGDDGPATDAHGWLATGDLARLDAEGNLTITGRAKDLIKSGGEWINPAQIEALVCGVPGVALVAVIARPDRKWGERPVLIVELRPSANGVTDDILLAPLRGNVPAWWIPDDVVRVPRMLLSPTGKIDKPGLRKLYGTSDDD